jgi:peptidoglycan/LPS O-acetylase OafA/YrhL
MAWDETPKVATVEAPARLRLHFLDGLRALASLYVLLFHEASTKVVGHGEPSWAMKFFIPHLNRGRFGVVFFIVLSGFSLMLPIARTGSFDLVSGFPNYLYRRARRIFPPYYAALAFSIGLIVAYNTVGARHGGGPPIEDALKPGSIVSHLLLVHNLTFDWVYRINGPMWSVATEWQIYFVFPAALLPLWRHAGGPLTVAIAWFVGSLPFLLLPGDSNFFWACPWFLGSFALGMAGAMIAVSPQYRESTMRNRVPWGGLSLLFFGLLVAICATGCADSLAYPIIDLEVSILAFCWINACIQHTAIAGGRGSGGSFMLRILGSRALVYLGGFSYSLYLVQHPILRFTEKALGRLPLSYDANVAIHLLVVTPLIMVVAWLFAELFERPFTSGAYLLPAIQRRFGIRAAEMS